MKKKWDVFISHSSEDKDTIVRELANSLTRLGVNVWYDEFTLKVGDSLSQKIDEGLIDSNFGIVVISEPFLNKKWTDYEYRSLLAKESNFKKIILPIWHDVTQERIASFSLYLADKFALSTKNFSTDDIARKLLEVIRPDLYENLCRVLIYNAIISEKETKTVTVNPTDIKWGEKIRNKLSNEQLIRIKNTYYSIGKEFNLTLSDIVDCHLYDHDPDREIKIWEIMNITFLEFIEQESIKNTDKRKEVAMQILLISIGSLSENTTLTVDELSRLYDIFKVNFYSF